MKAVREVGLVKVSKFWYLDVFRQDFFRRFAVCRLHLILLGLCFKVC